MPPEDRILAFDTSAAHCAAALLIGGQVTAETTIPMAKGQAEALMPQLAALLADNGLGWRDLTALAVGIGPGNFTGIRISVAAARGLALGLGIPALGVSLFEVMAHGQAAPVPDGQADPVLISLEAPHGQAYVQPFARGAPAGAPRSVDPAVGFEMPAGTRAVLGHAATALAARPGIAARERALPPIARTIGEAALIRLRRGGAMPPPAPLYMRPADAAPSAMLPPVILP